MQLKIFLNARSEEKIVLYSLGVIHEKASCLERH